MSEKSRKGGSIGGKGRGVEREKGGEEGVDELSSLLGVDGAGDKGGVGGMGRRERRPRRKVKWSDRYGEKLVEVVEFEPSDSSDSDGESFVDSCICSVM